MRTGFVAVGVDVGVGVAVAVGFGVAGFVLGFGEMDFVEVAVGRAEGDLVVDALVDGDAVAVPELEAAALALALADADADAEAAASYARTSEITTWSMTKRLSAHIPVPVPANNTMAAAENAATRSRRFHSWAITSPTIRSHRIPAPARVTTCLPSDGFTRFPDGPRADADAISPREH